MSSRHLAEGNGWETSESGYAFTIADNAFSRWVTRRMTAAGGADLAPIDILGLNDINHRGRDKRLSDICFLLKI